MDHYGIRGIALDWVSSYLSEQNQYVSVNGHISDYLDISCGVSQGSVLGPLLFLIYINDLPNVSKLLSFYLFADDTNIYFEATSMTFLMLVSFYHFIFFLMIPIFILKLLTLYLYKK